MSHSWEEVTARQIDTTRNHFGVPLDNYLAFPADCAHIHRLCKPADQEELHEFVTELLSGSRGTVFPAPMERVTSEELKLVIAEKQGATPATYKHGEALLSWGPTL